MQLQHDTLIRERAYAIWEQEGRPAGREWDHWIRAASEVTAKPAATPPKAKAAAPAKIVRKARRSKLA